MEKSKKKISEDDVLAAMLKVKPTEDMPKTKKPKKKSEKQEKKSSK